MITIKQYFMAESLETAYDKLMAHKKNIILGGMMWLRMQDKVVPTAIDLSQLGLDKIEEKETTIEIGAMTTLRQIEESALLKQYFGTAFKEALIHIVGTQFRNTATIGGSIYSRFGFSDPLTILLALNVQVVLYGKGTVSLEEFMKMPYEKDLLVKVIIQKEYREVIYRCQRITATDFPNLTVCISREKMTPCAYKIVVGARPTVAQLANEAMTRLNEVVHQGIKIDEQFIKEIADKAVEELSFGTNIRASKPYREHLTKVFIRRSLETLLIR